MSFRVDAPWIPGAFMVGHQGGGVLAEDLAAAGDNGDGFLADDVTLPADNGKEICGRITYWPPGLTLQTFEDGHAIASAADGVYVALKQLYVDYVATGPETPINFTFGDATAVSIAAAWTESADVIAATASAVGEGVSAAVAWTESADTISAACTVTAAVTVELAWSESPDVIAVAADSITYVRAPSGGGYAPRRNEASSRPAAIQRNER